jgi:hypothetical protein
MFTGAFDAFDPGIGYVNRSGLNPFNVALLAECA